MKVKTLFGFAVALAAFSQQPAAEKFYEELITTPVVPQRDREDIRGDLEAAERQLQQINKTISDYQARKKEAAGWVTTQRAEIEDLSKQVKAAKKEKREADRLTLDAQRKQLELVRDYLRQMSRIRDVELSVAQAQKDVVNSEIKVYQAELDLKNRVDAIGKGQASDPDFVKITIEAARAGETTLRLMKELADKNANVAGRMKQLADGRVNLVQARNKLLSEERIRNAAAQRAQR